MVLHLYQTVLLLNCSLAMDLVAVACFLVSILVMALFFVVIFIFSDDCCRPSLHLNNDIYLII
jgi:hypothetical protein